MGITSKYIGNLKSNPGKSRSSLGSALIPNISLSSCKKSVGEGSAKPIAITKSWHGNQWKMGPGFFQKQFPGQKEIYNQSLVTENKSMISMTFMFDRGINVWEKCL